MSVRTGTSPRRDGADRVRRGSAASGLLGSDPAGRGGRRW
jgi:hypothetical protein